MKSLQKLNFLYNKFTITKTCESDCKVNLLHMPTKCLTLLDFVLLINVFDMNVQVDTR